ncbi:MAG: PDZ domain-containing protein [Magnetococcales bacterium]|nr:PDZ domain-containing protein [Magnetococcales bacterium]
MIKLGHGIVGVGFLAVMILMVTTVLYAPSDDESLTVHTQGVNTHVKDHPLFGVEHGVEPITTPAVPLPVAGWRILPGDLPPQPVAPKGNAPRGGHFLAGGSPLTQDPQGATPQAVTPPARNFQTLEVRLAEGHWQGLEALPLSPELKRKLRLPANLKGLLVDEVTLNAAASGMLAGDVLVAVNGHPVTTLEALLKASKQAQNLDRIPVTVVRRGQTLTFTLRGNKRLGFAQVETAPMILAGDIAPHPYRGQCTNCHPIGTTGHITPDPDGIILPPPPIRFDAQSPHRDRGQCRACHTIIN